MQNIRDFLRYWLVIVLWMSLIFVGSSDTGSFHHSSRIIEPILRWLFPKITDQTVNDVVFFARKCAHMTEYGLFGMMLWRALRKPFRGDTRPWRWREAGLALLIAALYASTDEYHQTFVKGREGCVRDVVIDTCGAAAGLFLIWRVGRWRRRW